MKNKVKRVLYQFVACITAVSILGGGYLTPLEIYATENTNNVPTLEELQKVWDCTEDVDENGNLIIILRYYIGSEKDVTVYGSYIIDGETYQTKLDKDSSNMFNPLRTDMNDDQENDETIDIAGITSIKFDKGVDTSEVTDMNSMFANCTALTELDISGFKTSKVTNMARMFDGLQQLKELDLSNFDTTNVTTMAQMFQNNHALQKLNLSSFNTNAIMDGGDPDTLKWMFEGCDSMKEILISDSWNISKEMAVTSQMFTGDPNYYVADEPGKEQHTPCKIPYDRLTNVKDLPQEEPVMELDGLYDAAAGKWVEWEQLDNIRPYGQCKDHKDWILGVKLTGDNIDDMQFFWVKKGEKPVPVKLNVVDDKDHKRSASR